MGQMEMAPGLRNRKKRGKKKEEKSLIKNEQKEMAELFLFPPSPLNLRYISKFNKSFFIFRLSRGREREKDLFMLHDRKDCQFLLLSAFALSRASVYAASAFCAH
jgi:hypothetical protein